MPGKTLRYWQRRCGQGRAAGGGGPESGPNHHFGPQPGKSQNSLSRFLAAQPETQLKLYTELEDLPGGDVIINTTPIGMYPKTGVSPVPASFVGKFGAAVDIIYNPAVTQFLADAAAAGAKTCNGLHMLVGQAVAAEEIWLQKNYRQNWCRKS